MFWEIRVQSQKEACLKFSPAKAMWTLSWAMRPQPGPSGKGGSKAEEVSSHVSTKNNHKIKQNSWIFNGSSKSWCRTLTTWAKAVSISPYPKPKPTTFHLPARKGRKWWEANNLLFQQQIRRIEKRSKNPPQDCVH